MRSKALPAESCLPFTAKAQGRKGPLSFLTLIGTCDLAGSRQGPDLTLTLTFFFNCIFLIMNL